MVTNLLCGNSCYLIYFWPLKPLPYLTVYETGATSYINIQTFISFFQLENKNIESPKGIENDEGDVHIFSD